MAELPSLVGAIHLDLDDDPWRATTRIIDAARAGCQLDCAVDGRPAA